MDPRTERMLAERRAGQASPAAPVARAARLKAKAAEWLSAHWRVAGAGLVIGLLGISFAYYVLITLPAREQERQMAAQREAGRQQGLEELARGESLDTCLAAAQTDFATNWDAACRELRRAESCTLPSDRAEPLDTRLRLAREDCFKRHTSR